MLTQKLSRFWQWLKSPPLPSPTQTLDWLSESTTDPDAFGEQLRRLQHSLHEANQPEVVIENSL